MISSNFQERWICSTVQAENGVMKDNEGISCEKVHHFTSIRAQPLFLPFLDNWNARRRAEGMPSICGSSPLFQKMNVHLYRLP